MPHISRGLLPDTNTPTIEVQLLREPDADAEYGALAFDRGRIPI